VLIHVMDLTHLQFLFGNKSINVLSVEMDVPLGIIIFVNASFDILTWNI